MTSALRSAGRLLLLAACDVVLTMSTFSEGWNRTAHEAMMSSTPVVGSGTAGMGELLRGGGQLICGDFAELRKYVQMALDQGQELGRRGRRYAEQLTLDRFRREWLAIVDRTATT